MTLRYNSTLRTAQGTAVATEAGSSAQIKIYSGAIPSGTYPPTATGTLLATVTVTGAFGTASAGVLTLGTMASVTAAGTGTAGWFRAFKSDGTTAVLDGEVGASGSGKELILNSTSITSGGTVQITSGTITTGNA